MGDFTLKKTVCII